MCQEPRRNSPSVTPLRPSSACMRDGVADRRHPRAGAAPRPRSGRPACSARAAAIPADATGCRHARPGTAVLPSVPPGISGFARSRLRRQPLGASIACACARRICDAAADRDDRPGIRAAYRRRRAARIGRAAAPAFGTRDIPRGPAVDGSLHHAVRGGVPRLCRLPDRLWVVDGAAIPRSTPSCSTIRST